MDDDNNQVGTASPGGGVGMGRDSHGPHRFRTHQYVEALQMLLSLHGPRNMLGVVVLEELVREPKLTAEEIAERVPEDLCVWLPQRTCVFHVEEALRALEVAGIAQRHEPPRRWIHPRAGDVRWEANQLLLRFLDGIGISPHKLRPR